MQIIDRATWGAQHPDGDGPAPLPATAVYLHHSVTVAPDLVPPFDDEDQAVRQLEAIGQQRFGRGISYSFAVMPTGRVYEGHSIGRRGTHTKGLNGSARAIVLVGDYSRRAVMSTQVESVAQLLVDGWRGGWWTEPYLAGGHRSAPGAATECPGDNAAAAIPAINARARQLALRDLPAQKDDDTMPLTDDDAELIAAKVWAKRFRETDAAGIKLPEMSAGQRLDAIHRLGALGKTRDAEMRTKLAQLDAAEVVDLVPVEIAAEVVALLGRKLYDAAPPTGPAPVRGLVALVDDEPGEHRAEEGQEPDAPPAESTDTWRRGASL